jgi:hypothetical protein
MVVSGLNVEGGSANGESVEVPSPPNTTTLPAVDTGETVVSGPNSATVDAIALAKSLAAAKISSMASLEEASKVVPVEPVVQVVVRSKEDPKKKVVPVEPVEQVVVPSKEDPKKKVVPVEPVEQVVVPSKEDPKKKATKEKKKLKASKP